MIYRVYVLNDEKTGLSQLPTFARNNAEIVRSLQSLPEDNYIRRFPSDFVMYCIGEFDSEKPVKGSFNLFEQEESYKTQKHIESFRLDTIFPNHEQEESK